jgi:8-oxo-dGTP diphosphatase
VTPASPSPIRIVAALIRHKGRILTVLKRGTSTYMLPGGKPEPGESEIASLARELAEELGTAPEGPAPLIGRYLAAAANEPGRQVEAAVFAVRLAGTPRAQAEIAELRWVDPAHAEVRLAPLLVDHVIPALKLNRNSS